MVDVQADPACLQLDRVALGHQLAQHRPKLTCWVMPVAPADGDMQQGTPVAAGLPLQVVLRHHVIHAVQDVLQDPALWGSLLDEEDHECGCRFGATVEDTDVRAGRHHERELQCKGPPQRAAAGQLPWELRSAVSSASELKR